MAVFKTHRLAVVAKLRSNVDKALLITGKQAVGFIRPLVPVKTGNLRSSITYATKEVRSEAVAVNGFTAAEKGLVERPDRKNVLYVGTNVEYAAHIEFGTNRRGNLETRQGNLLKRKSFLRLGVFTHRSELRHTFATAMVGLIK